MRLVLDASVAAKLFYIEAGRDAALALVAKGAEFIAPDLIFAEFAHLSARKVSRGGVSPEFATKAVGDLTRLLEEVWPTKPLALAAFKLAITQGFTAYDATYLALAEELGLAVVTADIRLVNRAVGAGLGDRVLGLSDAA